MNHPEMKEFIVFGSKFLYKLCFSTGSRFIIEQESVLHNLCSFNISQWYLEDPFLRIFARQKTMYSSFNMTGGH